ncbi:uncharacterized protein LOC110463510 [Mizuhopecten yessoensis]|uniref:uncharacterized protein LOC110463510 n=1 Tax=Mizuhopecten yessoensis TaxID=6573 RepID=UPI000B45BF78|nr:uncharacterized protein LOC110463510 [Mizuhopecten yessoensis]
MLKSVAFENFGNFVGYQKLEFEEGANFIIGSNAVGKGLILDLIRRCVSTKEYISHYRIHDEDKPAYIISKYLVEDKPECTETITKLGELCGVKEIKGNCNVVGCIIIQKEEKERKQEEKERDGTTENVYKVYKLGQVEIGENTHSFLNIWKCDQKSTFVKTQTLVDVNKAFQKFLGCINGDSRKRTEELQKLLKFFKGLETTHNSEEYEHAHDSESSELLRSKCLGLFQAISDVSVSVFAKRSIGPVQWDKSVFDKPGDEDKGNNETIREKRRKKKHDDANDRAEILQELLPPEETEDLQTAKNIFATLIYPFEFTFKKVVRKKDETDDKEKKYDIYLQNGKKNAPTRLELLRVPEGIIEAMHFSLILAQKNYKTICLKEPDKGMHPQMIEKMRDLVLRSQHRKGKVLLLVSHNPAMIHHWAIHRTFVCRQKRDKEGNSVHSVLKVKSDDNMRVRLIHEELKNTMFAASVLFVEGIHDKLVMTMVFDQILHPDFSLEDFKSVNAYKDKGNDNLESLRKLVSGLAVVNMDGQTCRKNLTDMARTIELPYILLLDIDVAYSCTRLTDRWKHVKTLLKDFGGADYNGNNQIEEVKQELQKNVKKTKEEYHSEMRRKLRDHNIEEDDIDKCIEVVDNCRPYQTPKGNNNTQMFSEAVSLIQQSKNDVEKKVALCVKALLDPNKDKFEQRKIQEMLGVKEWPEKEKEISPAVIKDELSKARIHCWEKGNLEEVICKAVLVNNSAEELTFLRNVFNLAAVDKERYGKKFLSHIEEGRLKDLVSKHLLKCEEMEKFLLFLLQQADKDFPLKDTTAKM